MTTFLDAAPATAARATLPAVRRPSLARLTAVELRKTTDTRAGRWLLLVIGGLAVAALGWRIYNADNTLVGFEHWYGTALQAVQMLLPVLGVLAMTSEWTQRTALTTFTLVPQRARVLTAKLAAAVLVSVAGVLLIAGVSAVATLVGGAMTGDVVDWGDVPRLVSGATVAMALNVLMGAAFGALLQQTAAALVAFFVVPTMWVAIATPLLGESARWLDVFSAFGAISRFEVADVLGYTVTAVAAWVVLPMVLGFWRSVRREAS
jgi:hypothetical protein